ncbi:MAG: phosphotransferase [Clostridia bacterium]|nr:phosphotransferase [Clostridia bacterium]
MKSEDVKVRTIYQDQRIAEEFCNFRCDYCEGFCPSGYSIATDNEGNLKVPAEWHDKIHSLPDKVKVFFEQGRTMNQFYQLANEVMKETKKEVATDILKISGGEVTTNGQLLEFVKSIHQQYSMIQILTNGLNLTNDDLDQYKQMGNVTFQVSIDGATAESNYAKSHNALVTKRVLDNLDYMIKKGLGVEINCVLTKYNTDKFLEFLERFKDANDFMVVPRPVRGKPREVIDFSTKQVLIFEQQVKENFERYKKILPPKEYIDRLIEMMKTGKRNSYCYIPFFVLSIDGYGNFEQCPIGLMPRKRQNIIEGTVEKNEILIHSNYQVINNYQLCEYCIVQYEMLNLYVEGKISKEELRRMPSLNSDMTTMHIDEIKQDIIMKDLKKQLEGKYEIKINQIEKNEESTDGNVFIITSNSNKKYVIKVYQTKEHTKEMIKVHSLLMSAGLNVPKIISSKENEEYGTLINGNYFIVYSFIKGKQVDYDQKTSKLDSNIVKAIAKTLRGMHDITNGENKCHLPGIPFQNENNIHRYSVLHFDMTRKNIFITENNDEKISFIDFDDAKYGPSVCDVAIALANLFLSKTRGTDMDGINQFIEEYYAGDKELKSEELPLIKTLALQWVDYILEGNDFDTSTTESFVVRRKLIEKNL